MREMMDYRSSLILWVTQTFFSAKVVSCCCFFYLKGITEQTLLLLQFRCHVHIYNMTSRQRYNFQQEHFSVWCCHTSLWLAQLFQSDGTSDVTVYLLITTPSDLFYISRSAFARCCTYMNDNSSWAWRCQVFSVGIHSFSDWAENTTGLLIAELIIIIIITLYEICWSS